MESFMEESQIQSVWLSGEDEPHPLKDERYERDYFYLELQRQAELKLNEDEDDEEDDDDQTEMSLARKAQTSESTSNDDENMSLNDKTPLLPPKQ